VTYRHIVVGTDGSETAAGAVRHAAALAGALGSKLTVVTAFTPDPGTERAAAEAPDEVRWRITDATAAEERAAAGQRVAQEAGATDVVTVVEPGDPAHVLLETAEQQGADLVVVGSKGMAAASRFLLGSVPNRISHHAPCDVIIVHTAR
jgi:nucleotide-binding universal stress UspA family protein